MQFNQPDTLIPGLYNPQSLNRYSYVNNNPVRYNDPSGHMLDDGCNSGQCGGSTVDVIETLMKAGKDPKKKQYRQRAIEVAIDYYDIDTSRFMNGKPLYTTSLIVQGESANGHTLPDRTVLIGPDAFDGSSGMLAGTIAHEGLHALQAIYGRYYPANDRAGSGLNEVEAYDYEIATAEKYGLTASEVQEVQERRLFYHNTLLDPDHQQRVTQGIYTKTGNTVSEWVRWLTHPGELP